jgi:hypothetical protein
MITKYLSHYLKGRDSFGDLDVIGRIVLRWILKKSGVRLWAGFMWLKKKSGGGLL